MEESEKAALIFSLNKSGLTLRQIANKLNDDGIPTKSGRGVWESKMVSRILEMKADKARDSLNAVREKTGLSHEVIQEKQKEVDRLHAELKSVKTELNIAKSMILDKNSEINELWSYKKRFEEFRKINENLALQLANLPDLRTKKEFFKSESERLQRSLNEAESRIGAEYDERLTRLGSELAEANQTIQELRDKQEFLRLDIPVRDKNVPRNYKGWTVRFAKSKNSNDGYYTLFKKISRKLKSIYVGKFWTPDIADRRIEAFYEREHDKFQSFEDSLRSICYESKRTYRLDTVREKFPGIDKSEFDREMLRLAGEYKIELLGGDPRECDPADLIRDNNITYVNFEWRDPGDIIVPVSSVPESAEEEDEDILQIA